MTSIARTWLDLASRLTFNQLVEVGDQIISEHRRNFGQHRKPKVPLAKLRAYLADKSAIAGLPKARAALELMRIWRRLSYRDPRSAHPPAV